MPDTISEAASDVGSPDAREPGNADRAMFVERLTVEDQLMLWPDEIWPQENGALAILDGNCLLDPDGRFQIETVRDVIAARLHLVPRFRQIIYVPPRGLGGPLWVDAPAFNLSDHVRVVRLPAPGDEAALLKATEQLRRRRLDRSRPLWEISFLIGLPDRRIGMFVKIHHAIADGIAAVAIATAFLDHTPDAANPATPPWIPLPPPTVRELISDNLRSHSSELKAASSALTRPVTTARRARAAWLAMREMFAAEPARRTSLNRVVGPDRNLALIRADLDQIKQIAHSHDAKVNDVLLTAIAGGLRGLLRSRGEPTDDLIVRVYVPVTLRQPQQRAQARGNLVADMVVPLPVGVSDPGRRLTQIATDTRSRKAQDRPSLGVMLRSRFVRRALLKVLGHQPVNVTTADVPGPHQALFLAGARLLEVFPVLPLLANVSLGVGALSYAGQFTIMAIADKEACPDLDIFTTGCQAELRAMAHNPHSEQTAEVMAAVKRIIAQS
jgi:WS/DGAT/MGAT family acyltransferase